MMTPDQCSSKDGTRSSDYSWYHQFLRCWRRKRGNILRVVSLDHLVLMATIAAWFLVGVIAIITTKLLATSWQVPPLLLTTQQMILGASLLRILLSFSHVQPWPSSTTVKVPSQTTLEVQDFREVVTSTPSFSSSTSKLITSFSALRNSPVFFNLDFLLTGIFNSLDILASNSAFHESAASFVETVKASEPITTTAVALFWRIDQLRPKEACALLVLISGVLLSTYDNAKTELRSLATTDEESKSALELSMRTALTVMVANLCFAFRALCQKRYRANTDLFQLNDVNLLFRLQQIGGTTLLLPSVLVHGGILIHALRLPTSMKLQYLGLAFVNAACFVVYNGASCYVLSNVSILHHSGLNCLRRMFVTIVTSVVFGISISLFGVAGIILCFTGFIAFTYARIERTRNLNPYYVQMNGVVGHVSPNGSPTISKAKSAQV